jgi:hypothetical protein
MGHVIITSGGSPCMITSVTSIIVIIVIVLVIVVTLSSTSMSILINASIII